MFELKRFIIVILISLISTVSLSYQHENIKHQKAHYLKLSSSEILNQTNVPIYSYKIVKKYKHNPNNFTEGLLYNSGYLYEGTGLYGRSHIFEQDLRNGKIIRKIALSDKYFGEGITILNDKIYQLTLESNVGFVYDKKTFKLLREFHYTGQGWGLTTDGKVLIMSDGSSSLRFINPRTFTEIKHIFVTDGTNNIGYLNELEYINGKIYANVWQRNFIVIISPTSGKVVAWIDLSGINSDPKKLKYPYVLNGIAYDKNNNYLLVTGKGWPYIYAIKVLPTSHTGRVKIPEKSKQRPF